MVKLYTKMNCQPCKATKRFLDKNSIPYVEESLENPAIIEEMKKMGHTQAPIVIASNSQWSGYNPNKLKELVTQ